MLDVQSSKDDHVYNLLAFMALDMMYEFMVGGSIDS